MAPTHLLLCLLLTMHNAHEECVQTKKLKAKVTDPVFNFVCPVFLLFACGTLEGIWPASDQENVVNSESQSLSIYFGKSLATHPNNLTWPLGLAFCDKSQQSFKLAKLAPTHAASLPAPHHAQCTWILDVHLHLKTKSHRPKFQVFCLFLFACGTLKASGQQVASKIMAILPPRLCQVTLATDWPVNPLI